MFDLGWTELLVIGIVALIVIGPKDLPGMFRTLGRFTAKARNMARDFQRAMDDAADQAGVKEMTEGLKDVANPKKMGLDALNDAADKFEKWEPKLDSDDEGPKTAELTEERQAQTDAIRQKWADKAEERKVAEAAASAEAEAKASAPAPDTARDTPPKGEA